MKTKFTRKFLGVFSAFVMLGAMSSCDNERDFPALVEEGVSLSTPAASLIIGEDLVVTAVFDPNIYPSRSYTWTSDSPEILQVTPIDELTATATGMAPGVANITITSADGSIEGSTQLIVTENGPEDVTEGAVLTVSHENGGGPNAGEGSPKLIDNDLQSKYLTNWPGEPMWVMLELEEARGVDMYSITSGNDAPNRDAKDWIIEGSTDGTTWVQIDSREGQSWSERNQTKEYSMANEEYFKFYRWTINANNGGGLIQISEFRLMVLMD